MTTTKPSSLTENKKTLFLHAIIIAAVVLSYFNSLFNSFAYDDVPIIAQNPLIRDWHNIPAIFSEGYWASVRGQSSGGLYRPITILSYLIDYHAWGLNTFFYHLENILLHYLCCLVLYLIAIRISRNRTAAVMAALLFAVHPLHVEVVANVVGRAELLTSLFTLLGFYTFINPPKKFPGQYLSPLMMMLGLLSKETAIVLPLLILAYMLLYRKDNGWTDYKSIVGKLAPYAAVAVVYLILRSLILSSELYPQGEDQTLIYTKYYWRLLVMIKVFFYYLRSVFFPLDLRLHYMVRPPDSFLNPWALAFFLLLGTIAAISPWLFRFKRDYLFYIAWYVIALLPVSNIIPIGVLMSDRAMYLPSVSACLIAGLVTSSIAGAKSASGNKRLYTVVILFIAVIISFGTLTHVRNTVWRNNVTIEENLANDFQHCIDNFPESSQYYRALAGSYKRLDRYQDALAMLNKAVEVEPDDVDAWATMIDIYIRLDKPDLALAATRKALALSIKPTAVTYAKFAEAFYLNGLNEDARKYIAMAVSEYPAGNFEAISKIAYVLMVIGMNEEAARFYKMAISLNPFIPLYHIEFASLLIDMSNLDEAWNELEYAEKLSPDSSEIYYQKGIIMGKQGNYREAAHMFQRAASISPEDPVIHYYLAVSLLAVGENARAASELEAALKLKPDYLMARTLYNSIAKQ